MPERTPKELEAKVLVMNGKATQAQVATALCISLPTIRAICKRNNVTWQWQVADQRGEKNVNYKNGMGRSTIERATRHAVLSIKKSLHICERCGDVDEWKEQPRHHKDRDRSNNSPSNIEVLCISCHNQEHMAEHERNEAGRFVT
jgi:5-methylcytosine-specific restriction endonuclease McrA